ncbi:CD59 protein, partial [Fasciolopsis buskii]
QFPLAILASGLECYACTVCRQPFSKKYTESKTGCTVCSVSQSWIDGKRATTTRGCDKVCIPADARVNGYGIVKACCKTDLCNSKSNLRWFKSLAFAVELIVFGLTRM